MKPLGTLATLALALPLAADQTLTFSARGRTYEVVTRRISTVLTMPGHWMYQPSVITPSPLTGGIYLLLFSSNLQGHGDINQGEALFLSGSLDGHSFFTTPTPILTNLGVEDLCDLGDARPIWDGSAWHVYFYAVRGDYHSNKCDPTAGIFEATGPTLGTLAWVTYPGTNRARPIISGQGAPGISEAMQWFFTQPSDAPAANPFLVTYTDWGQSGRDLYVDVSAAAGDPRSWYQTAAAYSAANGIFILPDAILGQSLDAASLGDPAVGFESGCVAGDGRYQYPQGIAFYNDLAPSAGRAASPDPGQFFPGPLESVSNDKNGARMFRPRLARNEYGYIQPRPDSPGAPHTWRSYIYYNDAQVGNKDKCGYSRWFTSEQRFSVSSVEIRER